MDVVFLPRPGAVFAIRFMKQAEVTGMMPGMKTLESGQRLSEEDGVRANTYALLGNLLARVPDAHVLGLLRQIHVPANEGRDMAGAWNMLRLASEQTSADSVADEYFSLFIGIGRGELVPYASWYLTGFLMEQPLALLRIDLEALGFERREGVCEPEDHAAALCETMGMIVGSEEIPFEAQRAFFQRHVAPWMSRFFRDLQQAETARFYREVGLVGERFMEIEGQYLSMLV